MGRIGQIIEFFRSIRGDAKFDELKIDLGGGDNATAEVFRSAGEDSQPLPTDYVFAAENETRNGGFAVVGFVDPKNEGLAGPGAKRTYSRDPETGDIVAEVFLDNDGTVTTKNENGTVTLSPDGSFSAINGSGNITLGEDGNVNINGAVIDTGGNLTTASGISVDEHTHDAGQLLDGEGKKVTGVTDGPTAG